MKNQILGKSFVFIENKHSSQITSENFQSQNLHQKVPVLISQIGLIHGRFQPFHKGHGEYLSLAKAKCQHIYIGITNPCPSLSSESEYDANRSKDQNNPLTYYERASIIHAAAADLGINKNEYTIVPFPISSPSQIQFFAPKSATYFITVFDEWGRSKVEVLKALGLKVNVLYDKDLSEKEVSATMVRTKVANNEAWETLVLPSVARFIKEQKLDAKIAKAFNS